MFFCQRPDGQLFKLWDALFNQSANAALAGDSLASVGYLLQCTNGIFGVECKQIAVCVIETGFSAAHQTLGAVIDGD